MKKITYIIGLSASMAFLAGLLFTIMHLPGATELFMYGFLALIFLFLPMLAIDRFKMTLNKVLSERMKVAVGFLSAIIMAAGVLLKIFEITKIGNALLFSGAMLFILGFLPFFFRMYKKAAE